MAGVFQQLLDAITGNLITRSISPVVQTVNLTALNAANTVAVQPWMTGGHFHFTGTFTATVTFQVSFDNQTSWLAFTAVRLDSPNAAAANSVTATGSNTIWSFQIPMCATHIRVIATSFTSGTCTSRVALGAMTAQTVFPALAVTSTGTATTNRLGSFGVAGIWYNDTTTALAASSTFTGTSRDTTGNAAGVAFSAVNYPKEVNVCAVSDVSGTLHLEISVDGSTWRRIRSVPTASAGGNQVAELSYKPAARYYRLAYTNGASSQTFFSLTTMNLAA